MSEPRAGTGRLAGKVGLVTGSTSGIGAGIARELAQEGARVVITGRSEAAGQQAIDTLVEDGVPRDRLSFHPADLSNVEQCAALIAHAREIFGGLDILVNNAGDFTRGSLEDTTVELWDWHMAVNVRAPFVLIQAAVPLMRERGGGSIVNIGSVNAYVGDPRLLSYSVSKGALMTFTKNVAQQVNKYRIRVNQLNVGWTSTEGEHKVQVQETGREDWLDKAVESRPFGRLLLPRDIAKAALYFASDDSALVTGSVLDLEQYPVGSRE